MSTSSTSSSSNPFEFHNYIDYLALTSASQVTDINSNSYNHYKASKLLFHLNQSSFEQVPLSLSLNAQFLRKVQFSLARAKFTGLLLTSPATRTGVPSSSSSSSLRTRSTALTSSSLQLQQKRAASASPAGNNNNNTSSSIKEVKFDKAEENNANPENPTDELNQLLESILAAHNLNNEEVINHSRSNEKQNFPSSSNTNANKWGKLRSKVVTTTTSDSSSPENNFSPREQKLISSMFLSHGLQINSFSFKQRVYGSLLYLANNFHTTRRVHPANKSTPSTSTTITWERKNCRLNHCPLFLDVVEKSSRKGWLQERLLLITGSTLQLFHLDINDFSSDFAATSSSISESAIESNNISTNKSSSKSGTSSSRVILIEDIVELLVLLPPKNSSGSGGGSTENLHSQKSNPDTLLLRCKLPISSSSSSKAKTEKENEQSVEKVENETTRKPEEQQKVEASPSSFSAYREFDLKFQCSSQQTQRKLLSILKMLNIPLIEAQIETAKSFSFSKIFGLDSIFANLAASSNEKNDDDNEEMKIESEKKTAHGKNENKTTDDNKTNQGENKKSKSENNNSNNGLPTFFSVSVRAANMRKRKFLEEQEAAAIETQRLISGEQQQQQQTTKRSSSDEKQEENRNHNDDDDDQKTEEASKNKNNNNNKKKIEQHELMMNKHNAAITQLKKEIEDAESNFFLAQVTVSEDLNWQLVRLEDYELIRQKKLSRGRVVVLLESAMMLMCNNNNNFRTARTIRSQMRRLMPFTTSVDCTIGMVEQYKAVSSYFYQKGEISSSSSTVSSRHHHRHLKSPKQHQPFVAHSHFVNGSFLEPASMKKKRIKHDHLQALNLHRFHVFHSGMRHRNNEEGEGENSSSPKENNSAVVKFIDDVASAAAATSKNEKKKKNKKNKPQLEFKYGNFFPDKKCNSHPAMFLWECDDFLPQVPTKTPDEVSSSDDDDGEYEEGEEEEEYFDEATGTMKKRMKPIKRRKRSSSKGGGLSATAALLKNKRNKDKNNNNESSSSVAAQFSSLVETQNEKFPSWKKTRRLLIETLYQISVKDRTGGSSLLSGGLMISNGNNNNNNIGTQHVKSALRNSSSPGRNKDNKSVSLSLFPASSSVDQQQQQHQDFVIFDDDDPQEKLAVAATSLFPVASAFFQNLEIVKTQQKFVAQQDRDQQQQRNPHLMLFQSRGNMNDENAQDNSLARGFISKTQKQILLQLPLASSSPSSTGTARSTGSSWKDMAKILAGKKVAAPKSSSTPTNRRQQQQQKTTGNTAGNTKNAGTGDSSMTSTTTKNPINSMLLLNPNALANNSSLAMSESFNLDTPFSRTTSDNINNNNNSSLTAFTPHHYLQQRGGRQQQPLSAIANLEEQQMNPVSTSSFATAASTPTRTSSFSHSQNSKQLHQENNNSNIYPIDYLSPIGRSREGDNSIKQGHDNDSPEMRMNPLVAAQKQRQNQSEGYYDFAYGGQQQQQQQNSNINLSLGSNYHSSAAAAQPRGAYYGFNTNGNSSATQNKYRNSSSFPSYPNQNQQHNQQHAPNSLHNFLHHSDSADRQDYGNGRNKQADTCSVVSRVTSGGVVVKAPRSNFVVVANQITCTRHNNRINPLVSQQEQEEEEEMMKKKKERLDLLGGPKIPAKNEPVADFTSVSSNWHPNNNTTSSSSKYSSNNNSTTSGDATKTIIQTPQGKKVVDRRSLL